ncbi:hypothetical protein [Streptomyces sp. NPDC001480]|uniref:hypothetical protein n=1 Tax=Streptomyces sp. NPDC001480 TaxID=3364577 RepID=UPI0036C30DAD
MKPPRKPPPGQQAGLGVALLLIDLLVIAWLLYGYGMTGWADSYDGVNAPGAPKVARQAMWLLLGGAVVTGGGLLALRWRISGTIQLMTLAGAAGLFAHLAIRS